MRRTILILLAAAAAGGVIAIAAIAPPAALRLASGDDLVIPGAFHVHTNRSDGSGSISDVAAAAARAGLRFVVTTDHGNGTRAPEPPAYRSGVLMLDGVEISTSGGHYAVAGMPQSPYPLTGEPRDVIEDVRRLGGFGVVAHGDSPRPELQWTDWDAGVDGIEWLSLDTAWRRASAAELVKAASTYWVRRPESIASILRPPVGLLSRFDARARAAPTVALASTDAHGLWAPTYEACFRAMSTRLELEQPLTGNAAADGAAVLAALRAGHHFTAIDAFATPPSFEFRGYRESGEGAPVRQGDRVAPDARAILEARAATSEGVSLALFRNGERVREARAQTMIHQTDGKPGAYRVEARLAGFDVPWVFSNPIYVGIADLAARARPAAVETIDVTSVAKGPWAVDHDARSKAAVDQNASETRFRFELGAGAATDQFASMLVLVPEHLERFDRLVLDARATRPLRMTVQFIEDNAGRLLKWQRSVYLDTTRQTVTVFFDEMRPFDSAQGRPRALPSVDALRFLIDTNNTSPGTGSDIIFTRVAYQR